MRQFILIVLIFSFSCDNVTVKNELTGEWVETYSKAGLIFDFKDNGEVILGNIRVDSTITLDYKYESETGEFSLRDILIFRTIGKIKNLTEKEFTLIQPDSIRLFFTKVDNIKLDVNKNDIINNLKNSTWTLKGKDDSLRIEFDSTRRWNDNKEPYEAITHYWQSWPSKSHEIWDIGTYNQKFFLFYSNHQTDRSVRQIREFNNDKLTLTEPTYMVDNAVTFFKKKNLTNEQIKRILDRLTSKRWTSNKVDTIYTEQEQLRQGKDERLKLYDINSKYEFSFRDDFYYSIHIKGTEFKNGTWKISKDGEFVIVDDEDDLNNWIHLKIEGSQIILSKLEEIRVDDSTVKVYMLILSLV